MDIHIITMSDSTCLTSRLPQELLDYIIEKLWTDLPTLSSCALVCRAFLPSSQAQFFSVIKLLPPTPSTKAPETRRLFQVLSEAPHLCPYVRNLHIHDGVSGDGVPHAFDSRWVALDTHLPRILQLLHNVQYLSFRALDHDFHWYRLPAELRAAVCDLTERSRLRNLSLDNLGSFPDLKEFSRLVASPVLQTLGLHNVVLPDLAEERGRIVLGQVYLDSLRLAVRDEALEVAMNWLTQGASLSQLRTLSLVAPNSTSYIQRVTETCATSLETFQLALKGEPSGYSANSCSGPLASLRSLRVLRMTFLTTVTNQHIPWITDLLHPSPTPSALSHLTFRIYLSTLNFVASLLPLDPAVWETLDRLLSEERFCALEKVELEINYMNRFAEGIARQYAGAAERGLHRLKARGVLNCAVASMHDPPKAHSPD
ncbi:hypothetical protein B0H10DRAFT_906845 [Mycena sp. CBHHK59/15]|nr:hypothetical protein B0H10DRAFT_906845 [Mycena sp. CBHHK59/15]